MSLLDRIWLTSCVQYIEGGHDMCYIRVPSSVVKHWKKSFPFLTWELFTYETDKLLMFNNPIFLVLLKLQAVSVCWYI